MKVVYLAILDDLDSYIGVLKKIKSQTLGLKNNGVIINTYIYYSKGVVKELDEPIIYKYVKKSEKRLPFTGIMLEYLHKRTIFKNINNLIQGIDFDIIYLLRTI